MIIEDVAFPLEALADGVRDLQNLCASHAYDDAIVFGHAKDGNLHFVLNQSFGEQSDVDRFDTFLHRLADLVAVRYGGALKAEHSTGRNMAPFLETEWGPEAVAIMRELKALVDPEKLLNPGVLLNEDPQAHITHLKALETVEDEVDPCIECGFCERLCPSRDLTLTPRQRIVVRRELARLRREEPSSPELRELAKHYSYAAIDTCAADGLCATGCPVEIDTGLLVKRLRHEEHPAWRQRLARAVAGHFGAAERVARMGLRLGGVARSLRLPGVPADLPAAAPRLPISSRESATAVYFPSCVSRVIGPHDGGRPLAEVIMEVCARAGTPVWIPDGVDAYCCGMPFASKGYLEASVDAASRLVDALDTWSGGGELPIIIDTSPCSYTLCHCGPDLDPELRERYERLRILDGIEFALEHVVPRLEARRPAGEVVLHPVCSAVKMELEDAMRAVVAPFCSRVTVPESAGCCGFAGDRGYLVPELTASATAIEAAEIGSASYDGYYSSSRTCEIGMTRATGEPFRSFWYLLDEVSR
jgi:D-lactate dehydrogenase